MFKKFGYNTFRSEFAPQELATKFILEGVPDFLAGLVSKVVGPDVNSVLNRQRHNFSLSTVAQMRLTAQTKFGIYDTMLSDKFSFMRIKPHGDIIKMAASIEEILKSPRYGGALQEVIAILGKPCWFLNVIESSGNGLETESSTMSISMWPSGRDYLYFSPDYTPAQRFNDITIDTALGWTWPDITLTTNRYKPDLSGLQNGYGTAHRLYVNMTDSEFQQYVTNSGDYNIQNLLPGFVLFNRAESDWIKHESPSIADQSKYKPEALEYMVYRPCSPPSLAEETPSYVEFYGMYNWQLRQVFMRGYIVGYRMQSGRFIPSSSIVTFESADTLYGVSKYLTPLLQLPTDTSYQASVLTRILAYLGVSLYVPERLMDDGNTLRTIVSALGFPTVRTPGVDLFY